MKKIFLLIFVSILIFTFFASSFVVRAEEIIYEEPSFTHFTSGSYILVEPHSNTVIARNNENEKMEVASIVKLMTTLLTLEAIDEGKVQLDQKVYPSEYACSMEGSQAFLDVGAEYVLSDILKSVIVASANDGAVVLAETISGTESQFVKLMNKRAQELGMTNTLYANSTGLSEQNQYSTALDTARLLNIVSNYEIFKKDCSIWMDKLTHTSGRETELVNTNRLIKYYSSCKGGKTGYTDEAGYCLSSVAEQNDMRLIAVVLKCKKASDRFNESMDLYRYGFANFENKQVVSTGDELQRIKVSKGQEKELTVLAGEGFNIVSEKGDRAQLEVRFEGENKIPAPVQQGDVVGKFIILKSGKIMGEVDAIAGKTIAVNSYRDVLKEINKYWLFLSK